MVGGTSMATVALVTARGWSWWWRWPAGARYDIEGKHMVFLAGEECFGEERQVRDDVRGMRGPFAEVRKRRQRGL